MAMIPPQQLESEKSVGTSSLVLLQNVYHATSRLLHNLLPSPLTRIYRQQQRKQQQKWREPPDQSTAKTEWLDGLRGLTSLAVCLAHIVGGTHPDWYFAYGDGPQHSRSWMKLPIIRLIYSGDAAVAIFFLISGYVLSSRPLQRARRHHVALLHSELASSVLRRTGRLLLPTLCASFATMLGAQMGTFSCRPPIDDGHLTMFFVLARSKASIFDQILSWLREMATLFRPGAGTDLDTPDLMYGVQFWTIPIELGASFVIYLYILALSPLRQAPRLTLLAVSACYFMAWARWDIALFLAGMFLADIGIPKDTIRQAQPFNTELERYNSNRLWPVKSRLLPSRRLVFTCLQLCLLLGGLFLASQPTLNAATEPEPWATLNAVVPSSFGPEQVGRFWVAIGAILIFYVVERLQFAKWVLTRSLLVDHLGRISFSLYLVHNAVMSSLGAWLLTQLASRRVLHQEAHEIADGLTKGTGEWDVGIWVVICIVLLVSFWVADVFQRFIDRPSVRVVKCMEACLVAQVVDKEEDVEWL
ncbi:acyltransferase 3 [Apodospora peruviana]|uniref:Acyltransferase 3 n=1 Tax=Apodospora peruviana TaxID=516989 RepID=A0AAE0HXT9_9PEZI|nr:acyltransferase 3 [Apodospora peruviana]